MLLIMIVSEYTQLDQLAAPGIYTSQQTLKILTEFEILLKKQYY